MNEQAKETVLTFINAMGRGDSEAARPTLDPSCFTLAKGFGKFAGRRDYAVMVGTMDALKQLVPGGLNLSVKTVTAEDDRVVVEFEGDSRTKVGTDYHNQYCMVFYMRHGLIAKVHEYFCTIHADEVLWPLIAPAFDQNVSI